MARNYPQLTPDVSLLVSVCVHTGSDGWLPEKHCDHSVEDPGPSNKRLKH